MAIRYVGARPISGQRCFCWRALCLTSCCLSGQPTTSPIDEGNPEDLPFSKAYMNRESYPTSHPGYRSILHAQIIVGDDTAKRTQYKKSSTMVIAALMIICPSMIPPAYHHLAALRNDLQRIFAALPRTWPVERGHPTSRYSKDHP